MADIDCGGLVLANQVLERLQHLDLGRDVERGGRLVEDQQLRAAHHRHGRHQALQLAAADLVGIASADCLRRRQIQFAVERGCLAGRVNPAHQVPDQRDLGDLVVDRECAVERRGGTLGDIGDVDAADLLTPGEVELQDVTAVKQDLAAPEGAARAGIAQTGKRDGRLSRTGLANQRHHPAGSDRKGDILDDRRALAAFGDDIDRQVAYIDDVAGHHWRSSGEAASLRRRYQSTRRLMLTVIAAMQSAG